MTEQAQVGDTVRVTFTPIEGEVYKTMGGILCVQGCFISDIDRTYEILSRATPPLPSEPGTFWVDEGEELWKVNGNGKLCCYAYPTLSADLYGPFRQLVLKND